MNDVFQNFVSKFLQKVDSLVPIRIIRILNPIQNRDKHYKKLKQSGRETDKDNFKNFWITKQWITKRNLTRRNLIEEKEKRKTNLLEEKNDENKSNLKEPWWTLKSLDIPSEVGGNLNIIIRECCSFLWFKKEWKGCFWFVFPLSRIITTKTSISKTRIWNQNQGRILLAAKVLLPNFYNRSNFC